MGTPIVLTSASEPSGTWYVAWALAKDLNAALFDGKIIAPEKYKKFPKVREILIRKRVKEIYRSTTTPHSILVGNRIVHALKDHLNERIVPFPIDFLRFTLGRANFYRWTDNESALSVPRWVWVGADAMGADPQLDEMELAKALECSDIRIVVTLTQYVGRVYRKILRFLGFTDTSKKVVPYIPPPKTKNAKKPSKNFDFHLQGLRGRRIILNVGTEEPRKNVEGILAALPHLPEDYVLLRVGQMSPRIKKILSRNPQLKERVIYIQNVPNSMLKWLYAHALTVHIAFDEGLGLPPIEAVFAGGKVLVSDIPPILEVLGRVPSVSPSASGEKIAERIEDAFEQKESVAERARRRYTRVRKRYLDRLRSFLEDL